MKVLILTEGGSKIGLGHLMRCLALAREFRNTRKVTTVYFVACADLEGERFIKRNKGSLINFDWIRNVGRTLALVKDADLVIIDSYLAPAPFYSKINSLKNKPYVVAIDDYNRINYAVDMIINPSVCRKSDLGYRMRSIKYLLGGDYVILRKEFRNLPHKRISKTIKKILITFGGMNHASLTRKVMGFLCRRGYELDIISADNIRVSGKRSGIKFHTVLSALKVRRLMMECDLCISAGGQTLYELACLGVPTIALCCADNQRLNLRCLERIGFIENIGWYEHKDLLFKLESALKRVSSYNRRLQCSRIGKSNIDGKGALRIVNELLKYSKL